MYLVKNPACVLYRFLSVGGNDATSGFTFETDLVMALNVCKLSEVYGTSYTFKNNLRPALATY